MVEDAAEPPGENWKLCVWSVVNSEFMDEPEPDEAAEPGIPELDPVWRCNGLELFAQAVPKKEILLNFPS